MKQLGREQGRAAQSARSVVVGSQAEAEAFATGTGTQDLRLDRPTVPEEKRASPSLRLDVRDRVVPPGEKKALPLLARWWDPSLPPSVPLVLRNETYVDGL